MFQRKEQTIRIEFLYSPPGLTVAAAIPTPCPAKGNVSQGAPSVEQVLKIAAVMVAVVNAALVILGYMRYVGILQQFGISRTEVAFTFSDLLSSGYVGFLNMTLSGQVAVAAVSSIITLPVMAVLIRFRPNMHSVLLMLLVWLISMGLFFLITGPYWVAFNPGKQAALSGAAKSLKIDEKLLVGINVTQEVTMEGGSMTGDIILAMPDATYVLKENVLFKIRASDGRILRRTHLKPELQTSNTRELDR